MMARERETFPPVTLGQIRGLGCRNLLVYCESPWCNHSAVMSGDALPDEMPVRALCPRMVCTACGLIGADVRPDWSAHTNKRAAALSGTWRAHPPAQSPLPSDRASY